MNIYVGNISWGVSGDNLRGLFEQFGEVASANIITDRDSGRSKGFGFVDMPSDDDARRAIDELNGTDLDGRSITVNEARPREERPRPRQNRW